MAVCQVQVLESRDGGFSSKNSSPVDGARGDQESPLVKPSCVFSVTTFRDYEFMESVGFVNKLNRAKPLLRLSVHLMDLYGAIGPHVEDMTPPKPSVLDNPSLPDNPPVPAEPLIHLTDPSEGVKNNGFDNCNSDLILTRGNLIVNKANGTSYQIESKLGQGTFGQVAKCLQLDTREYVAVKVIKNDPAYNKQAGVEISILNMLNLEHDPDNRHHIVRLFDSFEFQGHLCIVFELLGENLYELLRDRNLRGLPLRFVRLFTKQLVESLIVLQKANVIHCDLKPENILLQGHAGQLKTVDFGSACIGGYTVYTYIQSRFYRSPEVLLEHEYTTAIDMWSLGCVAAELFIGVPLFPGQSVYEQMQRIMETLECQPSDEFLWRSKKTSNFFKRRAEAPASVLKWTLHGGEQGAATPGQSIFTLLTPAEYEERHKTKIPPRKVCIVETRLEDIIQGYCTWEMVQSPEAERAHRTSFIHFLRGVLQLDPDKRWTPVQALAHPFLTEEPFSVDWKPLPDPLQQQRREQQEQDRERRLLMAQAQAEQQLQQQRRLPTPVSAGVSAAAAAAAQAAAACSSANGHAGSALDRFGQLWSAGAPFSPQDRGIPWSYDERTAQDHLILQSPQRCQLQHGQPQQSLQSPLTPQQQQLLLAQRLQQLHPQLTPSQVNNSPLFPLPRHIVPYPYSSYEGTSNSSYCSFGEGGSYSSQHIGGGSPYPVSYATHAANGHSNSASRVSAAAAAAAAAAAVNGAPSAAYLGSSFVETNVKGMPPDWVLQSASSLPSAQHMAMKGGMGIPGGAAGHMVKSPNASHARRSSYGASPQQFTPPGSSRHHNFAAGSPGGPHTGSPYSRLGGPPSPLRAGEMTGGVPPGVGGSSMGRAAAISQYNHRWGRDGSASASSSLAVPGGLGYGGDPLASYGGAQQQHTPVYGSQGPLPWVGSSAEPWNEALGLMRPDGSGPQMPAGSPLGEGHRTRFSAAGSLNGRQAGNGRPARTSSRDSSELPPTPDGWFGALGGEGLGVAATGAPVAASVDMCSPPNQAYWSAHGSQNGQAGWPQKQQVAQQGNQRLSEMEELQVLARMYEQAPNESDQQAHQLQQGLELFDGGNSQQLYEQDQQEDVNEREQNGEQTEEYLQQQQLLQEGDHQQLTHPYNQAVYERQYAQEEGFRIEQPAPSSGGWGGSGKVAGTGQFGNGGQRGGSDGGRYELQPHSVPVQAVASAQQPYSHQHFYEHVMGLQSGVVGGEGLSPGGTFAMPAFGGSEALTPQQLHALTTQQLSPSRQSMLALQYEQHQYFLMWQQQQQLLQRQQQQQHQEEATGSWRSAAGYMGGANGRPPLATSGGRRDSRRH
eukprot:TRINITY_DN259_c0_g1_i1.p1 TRINITY_DN259_c0_g1~~TRINITY_DN259_c0_g1_i1.p1  ORF type:complete len:1341 (-),score=300.84 TRINITY_DN259_c0_g1_i1:710-4732(-)